MITLAVITISDRASRGEYPDRSGPVIEEVLKAAGLPGLQVERDLVPDDPRSIETAILRHLDKDFILTTGGTGLGKRDITPEVTERICDRSIPGLAEMLRWESRRETPYAVLSRGYSGIKGDTVIVNLPGSRKGARFCAGLLVPLLAHAKAMVEGRSH